MQTPMINVGHTEAAVAKARQAVVDVITAGNTVPNERTKQKALWALTELLKIGSVNISNNSFKA